MVLFFTKGDVDSDTFIEFCYTHYRDIIAKPLPPTIRVIRDKGKKPRADVEGVYFNLSHTEGVTMVGYSHTEIGVDIEKIRKVDLAKFTFINVADETEFFEQWTQRESYCKFTGEGIRGIRTADTASAHFEHFEPFEGYHACVCAEEQDIYAYEIHPDAICDGENKNKNN